MLHGCTIGENSLIGIGAIVLNRAVIGKNCLIGAGATVTEGKVIPDGSLVLGVNKIVRTLTPEEIAMNTWIAEHYVERAATLPQGPQSPRMSASRYRGSLAVWALLLAYASLYPFFPLRLPSRRGRRRRSSSRPRYVTAFDIAFNVLAYVPLGTLACLYFRQAAATPRAIAQRRRARRGVQLRDGGLPALRPQPRLLDLRRRSPTRPARSLGALAFVEPVLLARRRARWASCASAWSSPGAWGDAGLVLVMLWLIAQLNPALPFFGAGNIVGRQCGRRTTSRCCSGRRSR